MKASTPTVVYRLVERSDIPAMARIRAAEWETEDYWKARISGYLDCKLHPQHALMPRVMYVALQADSIVGFIGGHLTRRYHCDGELEWINVVSQHRGSGVASELLRRLAAWFGTKKASRICVDVDPANVTARRFYERHGARSLNPHWMVWDQIKVVLAEQNPAS